MSEVRTVRQETLGQEQLFARLSDACEQGFVMNDMAPPGPTVPNAPGCEVILGKTKSNPPQHVNFSVGIQGGNMPRIVRPEGHLSGSSGQPVACLSGRQT